jgi:hypothetical protein
MDKVKKSTVQEGLNKKSSVNRYFPEEFVLLFFDTGHL